MVWNIILHQNLYPKHSVSHFTCTNIAPHIISHCLLFHTINFTIHHTLRMVHHPLKNGQTSKKCNGCNAIKAYLETVKLLSKLKSLIHDIT